MMHNLICWRFLVEGFLQENWGFPITCFPSVPPISPKSHRGEGEAETLHASTLSASTTTVPKRTCNYPLTKTKYVQITLDFLFLQRYSRKQWCQHHYQLREWEEAITSHSTNSENLQSAPSVLWRQAKWRGRGRKEGRGMTTFFPRVADTKPLPHNPTESEHS